MTGMMEYYNILDGEFVSMGDVPPVATISDVMGKATDTCGEQLRRRGTSLLVFTYTDIAPDKEKKTEEIFLAGGQLAVLNYLKKNPSDDLITEDLKAWNSKTENLKTEAQKTKPMKKKPLNTKPMKAVTKMKAMKSTAGKKMRPVLKSMKVMKKPRANMTSTKGMKKMSSNVTSTKGMKKMSSNVTSSKGMRKTSSTTKK